MPLPRVLDLGPPAAQVAQRPDGDADVGEVLEVAAGRHAGAGEELTPSSRADSPSVASRRCPATTWSRSGVSPLGSVGGPTDERSEARMRSTSSWSTSAGAVTSSRTATVLERRAGGLRACFGTKRVDRQRAQYVPNRRPRCCLAARRERRPPSDRCSGPCRIGVKVRPAEGVSARAHVTSRMPLPAMAKPPPDASLGAQWSTVSFATIRTGRPSATLPGAWPGRG